MIERAIMNQTRTIRLPVHVVKELNVYLRASRKLAQRLDHDPTPEEIAVEINKPIKDVLKILSLSDRITSIDAPVADQEKSLVDTVADMNKLGPDAQVETDDLSCVLVGWLQQLPEKQRLVFHLKYYENLKYDTISEITGTSVGALKASYFHAVQKIKDSVTKD